MDRSDLRADAGKTDAPPRLIRQEGKNLTTEPPLRDRAPKWNAYWVGRLLVFIAICEIVPFLATMSATAMPGIAAEYATGQVGWVMTAAFLSAAITMPLVGKLADIYGKKQIMMICLVLSTLGIVVSAIAPTFLIFALGRALQGFSIPVIFLSYSLIRDTFPSPFVASSAALTTGGLGMFQLISPFFVGPVIDDYGFKTLFWIAAGYSVAVAILAFFFVEPSAVRANARPDFVGAGLLGLGLGSALVAVSLGPEDGWTSLTVVGFFVLGICLIVGWLVQARHVSDPLINLRVLTGNGRRLLLIVLSTGLVGGAAIGATAGFSLIVMTPRAIGGDYGLGLSATELGWLSMVGAIGALGGVAVSMTARLDPRRHLLIGSIGVLLGIGAFAVGKSSIVGIGAAMALVMLSSGVVNAATPNLVIEAVRPEDQVVSASLPEVCRTITASIATVVIFAILNSQVGQYIEGQPIYTGHGFDLGYVAMAGAALVGIALGWAIPSRSRIPAAVEL